MATFRTKLKQLRDADVRYISLVDRAATRIPFRVLKRDKEHEMGIDLMRVFKGDVPEVAKPSVAALVVFAHKDADVQTQIQEAIKKEGFVVDRVQKSDEGGTMIYAQGETPKEVMVVRLGDHVLASVAGLTVPKGWVGDLVEEHGFIPDLKMATAALYDQLATVSKSETPQADAKEALTSFGAYLDQILVLPAACFKLDEALHAIVTKADGDPDAAEEADDEDAEAEDDADADADDADEKEVDATAEEAQKGDVKKDETKKDETKKDDVKKGETEAQKKKRLKDHPPAEMEPVDEEDDQKPPPDAATKKDKSGSFEAAVLSALDGLKASTSAQLTTLATKLEAVATEQATQKKTLDGVVQKADTLSATLKGTVVAPPVSEDRPAGPARMRVQKDEDPRTGNFDTAFLRRRR